MDCLCSTSESIMILIRAILITLLFGILLHKLNVPKDKNTDKDKNKDTQYRVYLGVGIAIFVMYFLLMALQYFIWHKPIQVLLYGIDLKAAAYIIYSMIVKH